MKKINNLIIILLFSSYMFGQIMQEEAPQGYPSQEKVRIQESLEYSGLIKQLFTQPDAEDYYSLGLSLKKDDKPIPALAIVKLGLKKFPDSKGDPHSLAVLEKEIINRISFLKSRYSSFQKETKEKGTLEAFGGMAAIKYHLGFVREAVNILDQAMSLKGNYTELSGLKQSFYSELELNSRAYLIVDNEFQEACGKADFDKSLTLASQLCYLGIYAEQSLETLDILQQTFPGKLDVSAINTLKEMPKFLTSNDFKGDSK